MTPSTAGQRFITDNVSVPDPRAVIINRLLFASGGVGAAGCAGHTAT